MYQTGEGRFIDHGIFDADEAVADHDILDGVGGAFVGGAGVAEDVEGCVHVAQRDAVGRLWRNGFHECAAGARHHAQRVHDIGLGLVHLVNHALFLTLSGIGIVKKQVSSPL
jgi:hypothetical protein